jgi:hypothetical protein
LVASWVETHEECGGVIFMWELSVCTYKALVALRYGSKWWFQMLKIVRVLYYLRIQEIWHLNRAMSSDIRVSWDMKFKLTTSAPSGNAGYLDSPSYIDEMLKIWYRCLCCGIGINLYNVFCVLVCNIIYSGLGLPGTIHQVLETRLFLPGLN